MDREVKNVGRIILERFLGMLSVAGGCRIRGVHAQVTSVNDDGTYKLDLEVAEKASAPPVRFKIPSNHFSAKPPGDRAFAAMFWLRRGLADRDVFETYAALMVCLQILAKELVEEPEIPLLCQACGAIVRQDAPSITRLVRGLVVTRLGEDEAVFKRLWRNRNAIVAHGDADIDADTFLDLTQSRADAIRLCFRGVSLALGLAPDFFEPHQNVFITSAFLHAD